MMTRLRMAARTAGADAAGVLAKRDVADVVDAVLDRPVPTDQGRQFGCAGLVGPQIGDAMDDLLAGALAVEAVEAADVAHDPEDLRGTGKTMPSAGAR